MNSDRHQQLTDLLDEALQLPLSERHAFLASACRGDVELQREAESLLLSFEKASSFIEAPVFAGASDFLFADDQPMEGRQIGHYRIVRELGRGGMGAVYLAERADEYHEQVALKIVKRGMDTDFVVRRFRHERQILASLHHPNIARLFDGGTTEEGLPYFVMEYIEGEPIDQYCDHHNLTIQERLKLFRTVCAAVQYAHQNLVIHRDLKPGNILITADGTVKLLDFGIAKILNPEISQTIEKTATLMRLMTPEYASPEQVRGELITTASDVYSLGVVLYELLTGQRPYRITSILPSDIERIICEQEPTRPSTAGMRDEGGGMNLRNKLSSLIPHPSSLKGDLDNIVLMALRKEPSRRYASVEQFAEDIRRHLEGLPVSARSDTFSYRAGKFVQRHKAGVAAAALIVLSLIAGLITTVWQARRAQAQQAKAERRFNDVRKLANSLFEIHDAIAELQGTTQARALIVNRALEYLDSLAQEASDDRGLQQELAAAYLKVGDVQGRPGHASLGDKEGALTSYRKAQAIYEALAVAGIINDSLRQEMTTGFTRVGDALQSQDSKAALASYRQGLAAANPTDRLSIANFHQRIGEMQIATGDAAGAGASQQQAMALYEAIAAETPNDKKAQRSLFINYIKAGNLLFEAGAAKTALPLYQKTVPMARALAEADPLNARAQRELAACLDKVGNALLATGEQNGARTNYNEAFVIRQKIASADAKNAELQRDLSISHDKLGEVSTATGNMADALAHYREALRIDSALASRDTQSLLDRANSLEKIGSLLLRGGDVNGALEHQQKSRTLREDVVKQDQENVNARRDVASSYLRLGETMLKKAEQRKQPSDWQHARQWLQRSLDELQALKQRGALPKKDEGEWDKIVREIARCDVALKQ